MIVQKFGGTSVEDASAMRRAVEIIRRHKGEGILVVVSACAGVTNGLLEIGQLAATGGGEEARRRLDALQVRHRSIVREWLGEHHEVEQAIDGYFDEARAFVVGLAAVGETSPRSLDHLVSYGERLSSTILHAGRVADGHDARLVDARSLLATDDAYTQASPLIPETQERLRRIVGDDLHRGQVVVTQGFIGSSATGATTTIGRGGSDHSASLFGSLLGAREIQIWTDVDGILTADPGIIPEAKRVRLMSFREASELSYFGARVLHPETIRPAVERGIPVRVLNSRRPESDGTLIVDVDRAPERCRVKSVAYKEGITLVNVVSGRMFLSYSFLERVFGVLRRHRTIVHTVAASDVSVSVTLNGAGTPGVQAVVRDLSEFSTVTVAGQKALVAVVGERLREEQGIAARVFEAVREERVNMISQGASEINLSFVVDEDRLRDVVRSLHDRLFEDIEEFPEVFG